MIAVGKTLGPFAIDKALGTGAMGAVYRAKHVESGKWVAIKIVAPNLATNESVMQRFDREWEILRQLKHPNIVRLIANGRFGGTPFYAMEYVEGESLDKVMQRRGRIGWEEVVRLGQQLCAGLKHAHDRGIVHRDLKPSNLMILKNGTVKLTDFGIAKDLDRTALTEANCTVGTAAYMSPEQCKGERNLTHKSDLYSMGVMYFELLTGRKPFEADNPLDMFMQHVKGKFERPSRLALDVPIQLDTLVCQLMEKDPERRPFDAATVGEAMARISEKVAAQQAAGIDAVKTRNKDKPPEAAPVDAEDRDAALALLGKKKKKKRRESVPIYMQPLVQAGVLLVALVALGAGLAYMLLAKPSPESLYKRAKLVMDENDRDSKWDARREGPIYQYLTYYGDREDDAAREIRKWADRIDAAEAQRQIEVWAKQDKLDRGEQQDTWDAMKAENAGDLEEARKLWSGLLKFKEPAGPQFSLTRGLFVLADRRLQALTTAETLEKKLQKNVTEKGLNKGYVPADDNEKTAADAFKSELKKAPDAREAWLALQKKVDKDNQADRPFWLLSTKHLRDLPEPAKKGAGIGNRGLIYASASRAAATVVRTSSSVIAADTNAASNWLHGKYTPRSIMAQKNWANRAVSHCFASS
jgi:eukaryotic-like serine/threonine-protein kinase